MALAFWSSYFGVDPPDALTAGITTDLDFFGDGAKATAFANRLSSVGVDATQIEVIRPEPGDATPSTAKVLVRGFHERTEPVEIDYVGAIFGYSYDLEQRMASRAAAVEIAGVEIQVMDPIDCLASRVHNYQLPAKRSRPMAAAQTILAIKVVERSIEKQHSETKPNERSPVWPLIEEVVTLAVSAPAIDLFIEKSIDVLHAVPVDRLDVASFRERRWPRIVAFVDEKRAAALKRLSASKPTPPASGPRRRGR